MLPQSDSTNLQGAMHAHFYAQLICDYLLIPNYQI